MTNSHFCPTPLGAKTSQKLHTNNISLICLSHISIFFVVYLNFLAKIKSLRRRCDANFGGKSLRDRMRNRRLRLPGRHQDRERAVFHMLDPRTVLNGTPSVNWRIAPILSRLPPLARGYAVCECVATCTAALLRGGARCIWQNRRKLTNNEMNIRAWAGAVLMIALPAIAWGQRPLIYPLRSQSPGVQSIDSAFCYSQATKQTGVNIVRQPQIPLRTKPIHFASDAGRGTSEPPLPASAAHAAGASTSAGASGGASQTTPSAASATSAASGTSVTAGVASEAKLPPLPPPEPPMTSYWRSFGDCMQSRGYGVR
jgi:hypothetical protein